MLYLYFTKRLGEVLSTSKIESLNDLFIWSAPLIALLVSMFPLLKRVYIISTMDDFEKVIIEKNQKVLINLYQSLKGPITMLVIYFGYALLFSFLITKTELKSSNIIVTLGLLFLLIFVVTILILFVYGFLKDIVGIKAIIKFLNKDLIKKISIINLTLFLNYFSGLITYTIAILYLIYSPGTKNIIDSLILLFLPVLLFVIYRWVNDSISIEKNEYTYKVLDANNINEELVFLYNLDSTKTVLRKLNINDEDEFVRVIYNAENNTYTEYKKVNV